jgi:RNA polymerase sigma factor (sigma-70 family)
MPTQMTISAPIHLPADGGFDDHAAAALTRRMVAGDRHAYEELFRARCALIEAEAARRFGRRRDLADDAAQECWLRIARRPRGCPSVASLDAWLRRVARSAAIDILRSELARQCRERNFAKTRAEAIGFLEHYESLQEIRCEAASIVGLSQDERALLELQVRTEATVARLAAWLGIGRAALDSKIRRAAERARMQKEST